MNDHVSTVACAVSSKSLFAFIATLVDKHVIEWSGFVSATTVLYTLVLTATSVMHNWSEWTRWINKRNTHLYRLRHRLKRMLRVRSIRWFL